MGRIRSPRPTRLSNTRNPLRTHRSAAGGSVAELSSLASHTQGQTCTPPESARAQRPRRGRCCTTISSLVSPNFDLAPEAADSTPRTIDAVYIPQSHIRPRARAPSFADDGIPESSIFRFRPNTRNSRNSGRASRSDGYRIAQYDTAFTAKLARAGGTVVVHPARVEIFARQSQPECDGLLPTIRGLVRIDPLVQRTPRQCLQGPTRRRCLR